MTRADFTLTSVRVNLIQCPQKFFSARLKKFSLQMVGYFSKRVVKLWNIASFSHWEVIRNYCLSNKQLEGRQSHVPRKCFDNYLIVYSRKLIPLRDGARIAFSKLTYDFEWEKSWNLCENTSRHKTKEESASAAVTSSWSNDPSIFTKMRSIFAYLSLLVIYLFSLIYGSAWFDY